MEKSLTLQKFLPYRLSVLSNHISRAIARFYEEQYGLTMPEWRVMAVVGEEPGLSAGQVAERTAMDKVAVSRAVSSLLTAGRLSREFASDDRRRSVLALSKKGFVVYEEIAPLALDYEARLLEKLSAQDKENLDSILSKLTEIQIIAGAQDQTSTTTPDIKIGAA